MDATDLVVRDASLTPFRKRVLLLTAAVPAGKVTTYNLIARALRSSPRAVGQALKANPFAPTVPCHRVVRTDLSIGGFAGAVALDSDKIRRKVELLRGEGVPFGPDGRIASADRQAFVFSAFPDVTSRFGHRL